MYAPSAEQVTPRSAALHAPAELAFVVLDESGEIAYFRSASRHHPERPNVTAYDIHTGEAFCFCKASECHRACWHVAHVAAVWRAVAFRVRCQRLSLEGLRAQGHSLAKHIIQADAAGQREIAANLRDLLDTVRLVWRERAAQAASAPLAFSARAERLAA